MNEKTKQFYYILRTPRPKDLTTYGLLYTSPQTRYVRVKAYFCRNGTNITCMSQQQMTELSNYGRFFLFIEDQVDNSSLSLQTEFPKDNRFLLYNFFVIPNYYKRITIKFEVVKTQILPDYFFRFSNEYTQRLQVQSVFEELSVVNSGNASATDAIAFNMQLAPYVLHNRISCQTIIDHISLWGAFFGVLFSGFAFLFLSFNRKKFYNKNPDWNNFKVALNKGRIQPKSH